MNPECDFIVTANHDLNFLGQTEPMKLSISSYRADRICELLRERNDLTVEDMKRIHYDLHSLQAREFMAIIRPLLPESENGKLLREWDLCL